MAKEEKGADAILDEETAHDHDHDHEHDHDHDHDELSKEAQIKAKLKEAITVDKQEIGSLRLKLTVTVPRDTLDERMGEQFADLRRESVIPGFRKGHAPLRLVEKRFANDVGDQLKSQVVSNGYFAAVEKEDLKPLGDPLFVVRVSEEQMGADGKPRTVSGDKLMPIDQALEHISVPKEGPLTFACEVELRPEFELPELKNIPVERPVGKIDDDDVEEELRFRRMYRGSYQPVEGDAVEEDDLLYSDMRMTVDGMEIAREDNTDVAARDITLKGIRLVGLGTALAGKHAGDTVEFEVTVPEDHENVDIRGKKALFTFKINEVKRLEVPPIDETFLQSMGVESEEDLRKGVRELLESRLHSVVNERCHEQIGQYLVDNTKFDIPQGLSQRQTERTVARRMMDLLRRGVPESDVKKAADEMRAAAQEQVMRDLKLFFILERVAEDRDIKVSEDQINGAIADIAARSGKRFDRVRDELSRGDGLTSLYLRIRDEQIFDELLAEASVTEKEIPKPARKKAAPKKKKD